MAVATEVTVGLVQHARRLERGEVEALPDVWLALYGKDIDPEMPVELAVSILQEGIERLTKGEPVPDPDDLYGEDEDGGELGEPVQLSEEDLEAIAELRHLRVERKDIEDREKDLRKEILQRLGSSSRGLNASGHPAAIKRTQVRRNVNRKKLEAEYPDVFDDVMTESEVIILDLP